MHRIINVTRSSLPPLEEFVKEIEAIWDSRWLTNMGTKHQELERELKEYLKVEGISLMSNGHMGLELTLQAFGLKGEVITTPFTFASTTHAIVRNHLTPVFCDINLQNFTIDPSRLEALITNNTCAILPVHVYGSVCNTREIEEIARNHSLKVIYDAAHAFGVECGGKGIGSFGDASVFSFHATKVFNTIEGGAVTFSDKELGKKLYKLKNFGIQNEEIIDWVGCNAKMNEFQASMGLCNLRHFEEEIKKRRKLVELYRKRLGQIEGIQLLKECKNIKGNYAYFPIVIIEKYFGTSRDEIYKGLKDKGVNARKYFYPLTSEFDCYKDQFDSKQTPIALWVSKRVLTLPLYADLEDDDVNMICDFIISMKK